MSEIRVHIDTLEYTSKGLSTRDPIALTVGEHNEIVLVRPERRKPVAVNAGTFRHDSCFPTPSVLSVCMVAAAQNLLNLVLGLTPSSVFQVFGHAEPSGDESHNKGLSDRRAAAFMACLVADVDAMLDLASSEGWGLAEDQVMLRALKCDPGPIDGENGSLTRNATFLFQHEYQGGVFHRHLPDHEQREALEPNGELDDATCRALIEAYVLCASPHVSEAQVHPTHPAAGCSEFNLRDSKDPPSNRRVSLIVHPQLPPHHDAAPCTEGDHSVCPIDGRHPRSSCLWYREHVEELDPLEYEHRHFDLRWLQLDNGGWLLSALTTLADDAEVVFRPFRTRPLAPDDPLDQSALAEPMDAPLEGIVRGGVAQVVWIPEDGQESVHSELAFDPGADPLTDQPKTIMSTFTCSGAGKTAVAPPPGRELIRLPNDADTDVVGSLGFLAVDVYGRVYQHGANEEVRPEEHGHPLRDDEPRIVAKRALQLKLRPEE